MKRRQFVKKSALALSTIPYLGHMPLGTSLFSSNEPLPVHLFSKHLQFLGYGEAGKITAEMGFAGLDLTVRPNGHVTPENVREDLPKALKEIQNGGTTCTLITTAVDNAKDPLDRQVLETAAQVGITHYRCNWLRYRDDEPLPDTLKKHTQTITELSLLNKSLGLVGCYQNHSGTWVGASIWEIDKLLENADRAHFGVEYDIRHATVEGGLSWENGLRLVKDSIKTLVVKDFLWKKESGKWKVVNVPIGEGMVDFRKYFGLVKKYQLDVPIILHAEYPLGGATHGDREITVAPEVVYQALQKDLKTVQKLWRES